MRYITIALLVLVFACKDKPSIPKPHAYPREYYPPKAYQLFDTNAPFSFMYPKYAVITNHEQNEDDWKPFWYNIHYIPFNATLHLSYQEFKDRAEFNSLFEDTRRLAYKHDIRAEEIEEIEVHNPSTHTTGIIYELKGNTATNLNFYISDGRKHFLRGALYFNARTHIDSILPMFNFLKQDVVKMIETTVWK
jgi:gliding motility-associated lipoprotein GldD